MSTPHNSANIGDVAEVVIMPGDPLRAKMIVDRFLTESVLVSSVRNIYAYTGLFNGKRVSVMASGMGIPSMGIYAHELFSQYGVEKIIRVGTAGALDKSLHIGDVVIANGSYTDSTFPMLVGASDSGYVPCTDNLVSQAIDTAKQLNIKVHQGDLFCTEVFYASEEYSMSFADRCMAVEMESVALSSEAKRLGKSAVTICTISDVIGTGEIASSEDREKSFLDMIRIALNML